MTPLGQQNPMPAFMLQQAQCRLAFRPHFSSWQGVLVQLTPYKPLQGTEKEEKRNKKRTMQRETEKDRE